MSSTKRVKFSNKKKVKKYSKDADRDEDDDYGSDELSGDETAAGVKKPKHSLDSDEEDNSENYKSLNRDTLNGKLK